MIQKTLSTFPTSTLILANLYMLEYDNKRITTFNKLINMLQVAERHDQVLLNNNVIPAGTKKIPKANYGKMNSRKNPKVKGTGLADPSQRRNNAPRGRGHGGHGRGRGRGHGVSSYVWRRDGGGGPGGYDTKAQKTPKNPPIKREEFDNEPCYRCGDTGH
ncbi:uncharacterized protein A4U43_C03F22460 [Asparagus officinalis]|uniref:CCHC-type domain-containing protein n=2 Tax=Asparagus officinalis TaxID=4686 RepID=A0A5P1FGG5_ASPOF|nr:uncharacterized protein A4U43_C03F22460 [Asparagus officinalis]